MRPIFTTVVLVSAPSGCFGVPTADETGFPDEADEYEDAGDFRLRWGNDGGFEDYAEWTKDRLDGFDVSLNDTYRLPVDVDIRHDKCGFENAYWDGEGITMCYEMEAYIIELFYNGLDANDDVVLSFSLQTWIFIMYHEIGHGMIDIYGLPVPGKEEDAVDSFSAVALIDAGAPDAVVFAAIFWALLEQQSGGESNFADEHSMNMQRFYNLLCWVYGSDPDEYDYLVEYFPDLEARIEG